ncbi:MAG: queuosine precursor transporter [bacterium]|nr:queuosine precursor transporter [bacterium]
MTFREKLYLMLSGVFIVSLCLGNVIGITKFVVVPIPYFEDLIIPAGLLAYPFTFLATDLICELYGKERAQHLVWTGFLLNIFILFLMWLGHILPDASGISGATSTFESVYAFMKPNVIASMVAYLIAQSIDVKLFHFWKKFTNGKHLWLRNLGSTLGSQILDTVCILSILYYSNNLGPDVTNLTILAGLMFKSYVFKFLFALIDTPFFYLGVYFLKEKAK